MFSRRLIQPELLDGAEPSEARRNLADLVRINRNFGGHSAVRRALAQVATPSDSFTLLDIGAASGDTACLIRELYPRATVTSFDYSSVNLGRAPAPKLIGDAFHLPLRPASFDFVLCSSFLHHFENSKIIGLLRNFSALARKALLVIDLERHLVPYMFLKASQPFFGWGKITVHDGQISVRAAFKQEELLALARQAGMANATAKTHRPSFRLVLVARKV